MSILKRLKDITAANINAWMDNLEDPEKMLDQYLREGADDIAELTQAVVKQRAVENRLKGELDNVNALIQKRQEQAELAIDQNNDDLARKALEDKKLQVQKAEEINASYLAAKQTADTLHDQLDEFRKKYDAMRNKRDALVARSQAAKAQKQFNESMSGLGSSSALSGFDRMEERVKQAEAEAKAGLDLTHGSTSLDDEFDTLQKNRSSSDVDDELAALKAQRQNG